jgi:hypothetical protein
VYCILHELEIHNFVYEILLLLHPQRWLKCIKLQEELQKFKQKHSMLDKLECDENAASAGKDFQDN